MKTKMISKKPSESETIMTEVVCPNDTNPMGLLFGGKLIQWMDIASAVTAEIHSGRVAVSAAVDGVIFKRPAKTGDIISIKAKITRAFETSMEIFVEVWTRKVISKEKHMTNAAYFTFVALDEDGHPAKVPAVTPGTKEEKRHFVQALERRKKRIKIKS